MALKVLFGVGFALCISFALTQARSLRSPGTLEEFQLGNIVLEFLPPYVYENGSKCMMESGCLKYEKIESGSGSDRLGSYLINIYTYTTSMNTSVIVSLRFYEDNTLVFKQEFPHGLNGTGMGDKDGVSAAFPRMVLPSAQAAPSLRFFTPGGYMIGYTRLSIGTIADNIDDFRYGEDGGLVVLFQQEGNSELWSMAMSALTQPMATNVWLDKNNSILDWGVQGQAENIPANFSLEVILHTNYYSINNLIMEWGAKLQEYHSTKRMVDLSAKYLSYYTDNGAYYYYNTGSFKNYRDALMSVYNYTLDAHLPVRRLELDSWWYYKGIKNGVKNWTEIPSVMPGGIANLHQTTGWPIVAHNRWFASDTDYAKQNGGKFPFTVDNSTSKALPLDKSFWDALFDKAKTWGLVTYIQDWLNDQYSHTSALHTNLTLGDTWLTDMAKSAEERDINILYCMSYIRHVLHSVTTPAVTQARASDDYRDGSHNQWRIGVTSLVANALGLIPFKDVFWSSKENHEDTPFKDMSNKDAFVEPNPHLQAAIATLSGGSVGPGDKAENLDVEVLMRSCDKEGLLLQPTKSLTVIDKYFFSNTYKEVWTGHSEVSNSTFGIIFMEDIKQDLNLSAYELNLEKAMKKNFILWQNYPFNATYIKVFNVGDNVDVPKCEGAFNFCLHYSSPAMKAAGTTYYFLGEKAKWVPVSPQRIINIQVSSSDVLVTVRGVEGEKVTLTFYETSAFDIGCTFAKSGTMKASAASRKCE
ncbi:hypothetical protein SK128_018599 [Halocaridina rubra]|uniref:Uncharacterized protein n=1 Tax=Halocaridina rubra TaxID=373956 RepID=A0AAN9A7L4_HALRR